MIGIGRVFLAAVAPRFSGVKALRQKAILDAIGPVYAETLDAHGINMVARIAHFTAQVAHESAGFRATEEFASGAAYENRRDLGNTEPGDGSRFKGRGLLQLTGRANYRRLGAALGLPLEAEPALAAVPVISLRIACRFWAERGLNALADADDLEAVTRRVNGGLNGIEDRLFYLGRAQAALQNHLAAAECPTLRRGASGRAVASLQALLTARGFTLAVDGLFGAATQAALEAFQAGVGLGADGIAGPRTWAALRD